MKINIKPRTILSLLLIAAVFGSSAFTANAFVPQAAGQNIGGADVNVSSPSGELGSQSGSSEQDGASGLASNPTPDASGQGLGGADLNISYTPQVAGAGLGGADSNVSSKSSNSFSGSGLAAAVPAEEKREIKNMEIKNIQGPIESVQKKTLAVQNCMPLITTYLKKGSANDPGQVVKLQKFLIERENANIPILGVFDRETEIAVRQFQERYAATVLAPWNISEPTGFVYLTTQRAINNINCVE